MAESLDRLRVAADAAYKAARDHGIASPSPWASVAVWLAWQLATVVHFVQTEAHT